MSSEKSLATVLRSLLIVLPDLIHPPMASRHPSSLLVREGLLDEEGTRTKKGEVVLRQLEALAEVLDMPIL